MAAKVKQLMKVTAQDATTVTLQPLAGETTKNDLADNISQVVVTFATARDAKYFDIVNRVFSVELYKK